VDPAFASLLGAIVGGLIGSGSNIGLDVVRAKRESKASAARDHRDARRAARLIAEEIDSGRRLLAGALEADYVTWDPSERQLPAASWDRYAADFASAATDEQWTAVKDVYAVFDSFNWHMRAVLEEERWTSSGPQRPLDKRELAPATKQRIEEALPRIDEALSRLRAVQRT
jgi:hypothetical protein